jgi:hypothetical protein
MTAPQGAPREAGRLCANGHQYPLDWHSSKHKGIPITNHPREMLAASGFFRLAKWNGFCVRCGDAVEWSTDRPPRKERYRRPRALAAPHPTPKDPQ